MDHLPVRTTGDDQAASRHADAEVTLFCLPHAGGSAAYYARFGDHFPPRVAARPLELPGRGRRCREPLLTDIDAQSRDLLAQILPAAAGRPYALFGHSMGAHLAHRCAQLAAERGEPLPLALFVSSAAAPGRRRTAGSSLPLPLTAAGVWQYVIDMGGVPQCIAESPDFRKYLEPILFADVTAIETWQPPPATPLPIPITVFFGSEDLVTGAQAREWGDLTTRGCEVCAFPGDHFYLQDHWSALADRILDALGRRR